MNKPSRGSPTSTYLIKHVHGGRQWKTPSAILSIENKSLPLTFPAPIPDLKCQENFTQTNHPFQKHLRRIGRAATVLVKTYTDTFVTLKLSDQNYLIDSFLIPAEEERCYGRF